MNILTSVKCIKYNALCGDCTSLSPDEICTLLNFYLNAAYVAYKGIFYKQAHGTAMTSPVSVTVAALVMEDVEQWAFSTFPNPRFGRGLWMTLAQHCS